MEKDGMLEVEPEEVTLTVETDLTTPDSEDKTEAMDVDLSSETEEKRALDERLPEIKGGSGLHADLSPVDTERPGDTSTSTSGLVTLLERPMDFMEQDVAPEREPLCFDFPTEGISREELKLMQHIKELAESLLYHWSNFPIMLPPSITEHNAGRDDIQEGVISFKDLFKAPTFDELEEVARDANGASKHLNEKQLSSIRQHGEFEVDSNHFPGQTHKWRLSLLLQKGIQRGHETLLDDMSLALRLLIITARNRFHSHFFSLSQSVKALGRAVWHIFDILIGMPSTTPGNIAQKLGEEHGRFMVAELNVAPMYKKDWSNFCEYTKEKCRQMQQKKHRTVDVSPPPVPYKYQTPKGTEIDLRLFNNHLMQKCTSILKDILEKESKGWYIKFKDRMLADLKDQNLTYEEIVEDFLKARPRQGQPEGKVNRAILDEYIRRVYDAILRSEALEALQPRIGEVLVEQAKSVLIMTAAVDHMRNKLQRHKEELRNHLVRTYPVRSRIRAWMNEKLQAFEREFIEQNQWGAHEEAIEDCRANNLEQAIYFLQRDLIFMRDREPVWSQELSKVRIPTRVFTWAIRIWRPSRWLVKRHLYGEEEVIPTVIVYSPTPMRTPRTDPDEATFTVEKNILRKTSTRYPFWRWICYLHRTLAWMLNSMFVLGIVVPWCSPVSLRALFSPSPFMPDLDLNQVNGTLCPSRSSLTHTLASRLSALWRHVRHSRLTFENTPDTGFLGKAFTRHVNRAWNYGVKGALGSLLLVLVFPFLCLSISTLSLAAAITTPLWMPVAVLGVHIFEILFYDFDHPDASNRILYLFDVLVWQLLIQGCLQPVGALVAGTICCPFAALVIQLVGVIKRGSRAVWDAFMFHAVIKKRGRVPACDSFVARRIAGPGLASNYFYQIHPEQALAAVESQMELHELKAWCANVATVIDQPLTDYSAFVSRVFMPFSAVISSIGVYEDLAEETKALHKRLDAAVSQRKRLLKTGLNSKLKDKIKLTSRELKVTVTQTAKMLESFYPDHVIRRLCVGEQDFWEERHLDVSDWQGLATQVLCEIFSASFLSPLEETDTCFRLEVEHLNMTRYLEMLKSAEFRDDLDVVSAVHTPKGDIDVDAPRMDINIFNPFKQNMKYADYYAPRRPAHRRRPWKKPIMLFSDIAKLEIPLHIPHPAMISLLIYNREDDQDSMDVDDVWLQRVVRAAEAQAYLEPRGGGGGGAAGSSSSAGEAGALALMDLYDPDLSTPDHTTTNSEPDGPPLLSHLAEQERAFSEDNVADHTPTDDDGGGVNAAGGGGGSGGGGDRHRMVAPVAAISIDLHSEDGEYCLREAVVYREAAVDNSCVVNMGDADSGESAGGSDIGGASGGLGGSGGGRIGGGSRNAQRQRRRRRTGSDNEDDYDDDDDDDDDGDEFGDEEDEESFKECYPNMTNTLQ